MEEHDLPETVEHAFRDLFGVGNVLQYTARARFDFPDKYNATLDKTLNDFGVEGHVVSAAENGATHISIPLLELQVLDKKLDGNQVSESSTGIINGMFKSLHLPRHMRNLEIAIPIENGELKIDDVDIINQQFRFSPPMKLTTTPEGTSELKVDLARFQTLVTAWHRVVPIDQNLTHSPSNLRAAILWLDLGNSKRTKKGAHGEAKPESVESDDLITEDLLALEKTLRGELPLGSSAIATSDAITAALESSESPPTSPELPAGVTPLFGDRVKRTPRPTETVDKPAIQGDGSHTAKVVSLVGKKDGQNPPRK